MQRQPLAPYLFLLPYLVIFAVFWAWPVVQSLLLSLQNTRTFPFTWDVLLNWRRLLTDSTLHVAMVNTAVIGIVQVPLMIALATALAVALNSDRLFARPVMRFAFFAPVVVGEVAYSAIFRLLFNTEFGAVNAALGGVGIEEVAWLGDPVAAKVVIIVAVTWRWTGYNAIILLAGLQSIPRDIYEAASLDGAGRWRQFWTITLPLLSPVLLFCLFLSLLGTLQLFVEPFLITAGGPGNATQTLGTYLYLQGFRNLNFGYASAIAYSVTFAVLLLAIGRLAVARKVEA
jgi:lactose/L-arabinose transport system permease protein